MLHFSFASELILLLWILKKPTKSAKFSPHEYLIIHELTFADTVF